MSFLLNRREIFEGTRSFHSDTTSLEMYLLTSEITTDVSYLSRPITISFQGIFENIIGPKEEDWNSRVDFNEAPQTGTGDCRWRRFNRSSFNCEVDSRSKKLLCSPKRMSHLRIVPTK